MKTLNQICEDIIIDNMEPGDMFMNQIAREYEVKNKNIKDKTITIQYKGYETITRHIYDVVTGHHKPRQYLGNKKKKINIEIRKIKVNANKIKAPPGPFFLSPYLEHYDIT